jgi:hypothetical protein
MATSLLLLSLLAQPIPPPEISQSLSINAGLSSTDAHGAIGYRLRSSGGWQIGAELRIAGSREAFISGFAADGGAAGAVTLIGAAPLVEVGPLELALVTHLGARVLDATRASGPDDRATLFTSRLGPIASIALGEHVALRAGWLNVVNLQLAPSTDLEALGQVVTLGAAAAISDELQAYVDFETGGFLGFDGDGTKYLNRGTVGLRWMFSGARSDWTNF